jgi:hypothetical protein
MFCLILSFHSWQFLIAWKFIRSRQSSFRSEICNERPCFEPRLGTDFLFATRSRMFWGPHSQIFLSLFLSQRIDWLQPKCMYVSYIWIYLFIYYRLNDAVSSSYYIASITQWLMNNELERIWNEAVRELV